MRAGLWTLTLLLAALGAAIDSFASYSHDRMFGLVVELVLVLTATVT